MPPPRDDLLDLLLGRIGDRIVRPVGTEAADPAAALLAAVPRVNDGDVITAEHHNALRAAVEYLLGRGGQVGASVLSFAPALLPLDEEPPWRIGVDIAYAPDGGTYAGWMPLNLPHGMLIDSVTVNGRIPDPGGGRWALEVGRSDGGAGRPDTIFGENLTDGAIREGVFERSLPPIGAGTPAQMAARRRVDRTRYHYWFGSAVTSPLSAGGRAVQQGLVRVGLTPDT